MAPPCPLWLGGFPGPHVFRVSHQSTPGRPSGSQARASRVLCLPARRRMEVTTPRENEPSPPAAKAEQNAADKAARAADAVVQHRFAFARNGQATASEAFRQALAAAGVRTDTPATVL